MLTRLGIMGLLLLATAPVLGQLGQRITPIWDVGALVRSIPGYSTVTTVDFVCRDSIGNWWIIVGNDLIRLNSSYQPTGLLVGVSGYPCYDPALNRLYLVSPFTETFVNCQYPMFSYTNRGFRVAYLDFATGSSFVPLVAFTGASCYSPSVAQNRHPTRCASDGAGGIFVWTQGQEKFAVTAAGAVQPASGPYPDVPTAFISSSLCWSAVPGSCVVGPASACLRQFTSSGPSGRRLPVDLSLAGPAGSRGGVVRHMWQSNFGTVGTLSLLVDSANSTFIYSIDVTSQDQWPGCGGSFSVFPVVEQTALAAQTTSVGSLAWLFVSFGHATPTFPDLPVGCQVQLDPYSAIAFGPQIGSAPFNWNIQIPVLPGLDNSLLFFQGGFANLVTHGVTEARSAVIRQF